MSKQAKPFLKWAGGKTQLLADIQARFPFNPHDAFTFIEPFVGSGAVLFWVLGNFPHVKKCIINDINADLINTYHIIQSDVDALIRQLAIWEKEYHQLAEHAAQKKAYYYAKREAFNGKESSDMVQAALFIFLNRTCFNGLYRVNKRGGFNVPMGSYKTPKICDAENLRKVSDALQHVVILNDDFEATLAHAEGRTIFYLDPPYKPISESSSFNAYAKDAFDDAEQIRLKHFCDILDKQGHAWMLSNSDVAQTDNHNLFFDDLYADYQVNRVLAKRAINANAAKRGSIHELLITNRAFT